MWLVTINVLIFVGVPAVLLAWLGFGGVAMRLTGILKVVAVGLYLAVIWKMAGWQNVSVHLRWVWLGLYVFAGSRVALQLPEVRWWEAGAGGAWRVAGSGALAVLFGASLWAMSQGREATGEPVNLQFPLRGGSFYVASGGSVPWVNPHMKVLGVEKYRDYVGQGYAIDVVELNDWGNRAAGLFPSELDAYEIYGTPVYAPCAGEVVQMEENLPDQPPPATSETKEGNHVFLSCGDFRVLLAHLKQGSVTVEAGQRVAAGQKLGQIGNSGSSGEPHLHLHAQRPAAEGEFFLSGEPLPMLINGRFLTTHTIVDARVATEGK